MLEESVGPPGAELQGVVSYLRWVGRGNEFRSSGRASHIELALLFLKNIFAFTVKLRGE